MVAVGMEIFFYNNVHNSLYAPPSGNILPAKVNDPIISRSSSSPGCQGMSGVSQKGVVIRIALRLWEKILKT